MQKIRGDLSKLAQSAGRAARMLRLLANEKRLLVLCALAVKGEASVTELAAAADLGMSALSQHLARLREDGLVATRKNAQTVYYRIEDADAARILKTLKDIYCA